MGKLHAYQPIEKFEDFSNPSSRPFKSNAIGFQEKTWTLRDQILHRFKKAAKILEVLFDKAPNHQDREETNMIVQGLSELNNNIYKIQHSLENDLEMLSGEKLDKQQNSINTMKRLIELLRPMMIEDQEIKNLGKLNHLLTELNHLLLPSSGFKDVKNIELLKVGLIENGERSTSHLKERIPEKTERIRKSAQLKKGKKMTESTEIKKVAAKKTVKKKTATKRPAAKKTAKRPAAKTAKRATAKKTAKKRTTARKVVGKVKLAAKKATVKTKRATVGVRKAALSVTRRKSTAKRATAKRTAKKATAASK